MLGGSYSAHLRLRSAAPVRKTTRIAASALAALLLAGGAAKAAADSALRASELEVCQDVADRRCVGSDHTFAPDVESVTFMTRIEGATGEAFVVHVWSFEGSEVRRIKLPVKNASYRTWSKKGIRNLPGKWKAEVLDPVGASLGSVEFVVLPPER